MPEQLEERVAFLEAKVARLKNKVESNSPHKTLDDRAELPWWQKIAGTFADDPAYDEAMLLGQEYRESLRPEPTERSGD